MVRLHSAFCILNYVTRIRVGIDGRAFTSPAAGVRRYVSELVPALLSSDASLDLVALGGAAESVPLASITFLNPGILRPIWDGRSLAFRAPLAAQLSI